VIILTEIDNYIYPDLAILDGGEMSFCICLIEGISFDADVSLRRIFDRPADHLVL